MEVTSESANEASSAVSSRTPWEVVWAMSIGANEAQTDRWKYDLAGVFWFDEEENDLLDGDDSAREGRLFTVRFSLSLSLKSPATKARSGRRNGERREELPFLPMFD